MHKIMIALAGAGLLALAGCASTTPVIAEAPQAVAKTEAAPKAQLTEEAKQALAKAEADIKSAQAKKGLWTTAQDALKKAKAAAEANDSAAVIKHAKEASELAQLGISQTQYPMTTISK
jgi:murein lipoprotein